MADPYVRTVTVRVTAGHIAKGRPQHACLCPVALALIDLFKAEWPRLEVAVDFADMQVWPDGSPDSRWHAATPDAVRDFVEEFDRSTSTTMRPVFPAFRFTAEFHHADGAP